VEADFWLDRWRSAQVGFHQPAPDKHLKAYWPTLQLPPQARIFVPLCGKSLDMLWLTDQGHGVTGVELSPIALETFCLENGVPTRRRVLTDFDVYEADHLTLYRGDFFKLTKSLLGEVSAVYDRAALISWAPALRSAYMTHLTSLIEPGAQMLLIAVEYPEHQMSGPPFPLPREIIDALCAEHYSIELFGRHEILDLEPRLRARGLTELREVVYRLTRL
jgi:thiopurine S-methyltransferase